MQDCIGSVVQLHSHSEQNTGSTNPTVIEWISDQSHWKVDTFGSILLLSATWTHSEDEIRDAVVYSIVESEWPDVKRRLQEMLERA